MCFQCGGELIITKSGFPFCEKCRVFIDPFYDKDSPVDIGYFAGKFREGLNIEDVIYRIFDCYYQIGQGLFGENGHGTELLITCEAGTLNVGFADSEKQSSFSVKQSLDDGGSPPATQDLQFYSCVDRDNAVRLAALLMAWADCDKIHGIKELP